MGGGSPGVGRKEALGLGGSFRVEGYSGVGMGKLWGWEGEAQGRGGRKLLIGRGNSEVGRGKLWNWKEEVIGLGGRRFVVGRKKGLGLEGRALGMGDALGLGG